MSLLEGVASVAILALAATAALGAMLAGSHVVAAPATRDQALAAAHNAAVEARAAAAYDPAAAAAILAAPSARWQIGDTTLQSSIDGHSLVIVSTSGSQMTTVRYTVAAEALPQGAIVDQAGNVLAR